MFESAELFRQRNGSVLDGRPAALATMIGDDNVDRDEKPTPPHSCGDPKPSAREYVPDAASRIACSAPFAACCATHGVLIRFLIRFDERLRRGLL